MLSLTLAQNSFSIVGQLPFFQSAGIRESFPSPLPICSSSLLSWGFFPLEVICSSELLLLALSSFYTVRSIRRLSPRSSTLWSFSSSDSSSRRLVSSRTLIPMVKSSRFVTLGGVWPSLLTAMDRRSHTFLISVGCSPLLAIASHSPSSAYFRFFFALSLDPSSSSIAVFSIWRVSSRSCCFSRTILILFRVLLRSFSAVAMQPFEQFYLHSLCWKRASENLAYNV